MPAQRLFWSKKAEVVTDEMWRLWNTTFKGMQTYHKELEERCKLIMETGKLKEQNAEFQMLLSGYCQCDEKDRLIYAPQDTVDFGTYP